MHQCWLLFILRNVILCYFRKERQGDLEYFVKLLVLTCMMYSAKKFYQRVRYLIHRDSTLRGPILNTGFGLSML